MFLVPLVYPGTSPQWVHGDLSEDDARQFPVANDFRVYLEDSDTSPLNLASDQLGVDEVWSWWDEALQELRDWDDDDIPGIGGPCVEEMEQCWQLKMFERAEFVYVLMSWDFEPGWPCWFRVPLEVYMQAWRRVMAEARSNDARLDTAP